MFIFRISHEVGSGTPRRIPALHHLEAFEAVARNLSVVRAAEELAVTPSAISHRLKGLEAHLGARLFHRTTRSIKLSDAGRDYLQSIASAFDRIEQSTRRIAGGMASDVLTIHCPPSFAPAWLVPRMHRFMRAHPHINLRIHASPEPVDFFRTDTDIEIRYGNADWAGLVVRPLMEDRVTPLASPMILSKVEQRPPADRLAGLPLIVSERAPIDWAAWFKAVGFPSQGAGGPRFDRGYLALQAAACGLGVALESTVFAEQHLLAGDLEEVFSSETFSVVAGNHSLVYPPIHTGLDKVSLFERWIVGECGASSPQL